MGSNLFSAEQLCDPGKLLSLLGSQCPYLQDGDEESAYFIGLF